MKSILSFKSEIQDESGFNDNGPTFENKAGTWLSNNYVANASNSSLITTSPFKAF